MNIEVYRSVLNQISNPQIKDFTVKVLGDCDKALETMPASVSGKYHPAICCQPGGLVQHVLRACWFANVFFNSMQWEFGKVEADVVLAALLLHDIGKKEKYFGAEYHNHPLTATKLLAPHAGMLPPKVFTTISNCVLYHMGPWTPKSFQKPVTSFTFLELMVYRCDYLASQKTIRLPGD